MNIAVEIQKTRMSSEEWQARVDLAAVYRLVAHYGWDDVIYNHVRTPDKAGQGPAFSGLYPS